MRLMKNSGCENQDFFLLKCKENLLSYLDQKKELATVLKIKEKQMQITDSAASFLSTKFSKFSWISNTLNFIRSVNLQGGNWWVVVIVKS